MKLPLLGLSLSGALLASGVVLAHHGWGSYDAARKITLASSVERVAWQNPHVTIALKHEDKTWQAVLAPPSRMSARGLDPEMVKPGTPVRLEGYPSTRVEAEMRAERIEVGARTYELR